MIAGRPAFKAESRAKLVVAILEHEPPPLRSSNADLDQVVSGCLRKDPDERWQSAADVAALLQWLRTKPEVETSLAPKRYLPLWTMMLAALVIIAGAVAMIPRLRAPKPILYERLATGRRGTITQARFAPDGRTVILGAAWNGEPVRIFVKRPDADDIVPVDIPPADLLSVSRSGELAILLDPQRQLPWAPNGTLARVSINGGAPRRLVDGVISADWSPDGSSLALIRDTGRDQQVEIRTSDGELVRRLFTTSSGFLYNIRYSPSGDRVAFISSPNRVAYYRGAVMVVKSDGTNAQSVGIVAGFNPLVWSPDGTEIWFTEGALPQASVRAASLSGKTRTLFHAPGYVSFSDIAGSTVLMIQHDVSARASCLAAGDTTERDVSWRNWTFPTDITRDGRKVLLFSQAPGLTVGVKPLDGSPMTALTRELGYAFSGDERSVLVAPDQQKRPNQLAFVPVGAGEKIPLPPASVERIAWAAPAPNGKTIIIAGTTKSVTRLYEMSIVNGRTRLISDEPLYFPFLAISPDSSQVAAVGPTRRVTVYEISTGKPAVIPTSVAGDLPVRFADDGSLFYSRYLQLPSVIYRYDFRTRQNTVVREVAPADRTGVLYAYPKAMTADAQCYCYQYAQVLSKLLVADGVLQ